MVAAAAPSLWCIAVLLLPPRAPPGLLPSRLAASLMLRTMHVELPHHPAHLMGSSITVYPLTLPSSSGS